MSSQHAIQCRSGFGVLDPKCPTCAKRITRARSLWAVPVQSVRPMPREVKVSWK